jgi:CheY-like chemotaxis protein
MTKSGHGRLATSLRPLITRGARRAKGFVQLACNAPHNWRCSKGDRPSGFRKDSMKTYHSNRTRSEASHWQQMSLFPSAATISDPLETLLVVDDDATIRALETRLLRLRGYTVLQAKDAAEALRLAASTAAIHLLVTDHSMPEVDGLELTRRFRAMHPEIPVLMVSGSVPLIQQKAKDLDRFDFLEKPIHFNEMLKKVRTLLDVTAPLPIRKSRREHY